MKIQNAKNSKLSALRIFQNESAGFTLLEVMLVLGSLSLLLFVGYSMLASTSGAASRTIASATDNALADISLRGLDAQLRKSHLDRNNLFQCSSTTLLRKTDSTQTKTSVLQNPGDRLSFVFTEKNFIGATNIEAVDSIRLADVSFFSKNDLLYLKSLDSESFEGLFSVLEIDAGSSSLKMVPAKINPSDLPCTINSSAVGKPEIINPLKQRKFGVELLRLIDYSFQDINGDGALDLTLRKWPVKGETWGPIMIADRLLKMQIQQDFKASTQAKGEFAVKIDTEFGNAEKKFVRSVASGYTLAGIEILNQKAVPQSPLLDDLYVTCGFRTTLYMSQFTMAPNEDKIPIYRIEPSYTETETLSGNRSPVITGSIDSGSNTNPDLAPQCWNEDEIQFSLQNGVQVPTLPKKTPVSSFTFASNQDGTAFKPVYCFVPLSSNLVGDLNYVSVTQKDIHQKTVTCTPQSLESTTIRSWKYDQGAISRCFRNSGNLRIGRLVDVRDETRAGPSLYTSNDSCTWEGSSLTTCDTSAVLNENPDAVLVSVRLKPSWIQIENSVDGLKVICE